MHHAQHLDFANQHLWHFQQYIHKVYDMLHLRSDTGTVADTGFDASSAVIVAKVSNSDVPLSNMPLTFSNVSSSAASMASLKN